MVLWVKGHTPWTHQRAKAFRGVSTGDAGGVDSDLHQLLHVDGRRLTGVELPAWPRLRVQQGPAHVKRTNGLRADQRRDEEEDDEGEWEGPDPGEGPGKEPGQKHLCQEGRGRGSAHLDLDVTSHIVGGLQLVVMVTTWLLRGSQTYEAPPTNNLQQITQTISMSLVPPTAGPKACPCPHYGVFIILRVCMEMCFLCDSDTLLYVRTQVDHIF